MSIPQNENMDKYLELAKIDDLAKKYSNDGYLVSRSVKIGDAICDLLLEKGEKKLYIEVAVRGTESVTQDRSNIVQLHKAIKSLDSQAEFRVVFVGRPRQANIEIEDIEKILMKHLSIEMPTELVNLAAHVSIKELDNVEISNIYIRGYQIFISGSFTLYACIQNGSNLDVRNDDGMMIEESFPALFSATLNGGLDVDEINFNIDVSSWYEEGEQ